MKIGRKVKTVSKVVIKAGLRDSLGWRLRVNLSTHFVLYNLSDNQRAQTADKNVMWNHVILDI